MWLELANRKPFEVSADRSASWGTGQGGGVEHGPERQVEDVVNICLGQGRT